MMLIKKKNYYSTGRDNFVNSQHILILDLNFVSYCSGWEEFSFRDATSGLKLFSRLQQLCSFFSPCQASQNLKAQLSKTPSQPIDALIKTPPCYSLTIELSKGNSHPQVLYSQI